MPQVLPVLFHHSRLQNTSRTVRYDHDNDCTRTMFAMTGLMSFCSNVLTQNKKAKQTRKYNQGKSKTIKRQTYTKTVANRYRITGNGSKNIKTRPKSDTP